MLYEYGFFILLSNITYFLITLLFGVIFYILIESVAFYIAFSLIRRYAGGFHASSEIRCTFMTVISIFICILSIKLCEIINVQLAVLIITSTAIIIIFILCPLDTPEKPLTEKEYKFFRKKSLILLLIIIFVIIAGWYYKIDFIMYPCCVSLILESILLILSKIKKLIKRNG